MDEETAKEVPAKKERPVFEGFNPSFKGFSQLPNEWLDEITSQIDNVAELKVVLYIYRHTWGFQEKKSSPDEPAKHDEIKSITTDEFAHGRKRKDGTRMDNGTGLGLTAVKDGVAKAIKHGYVICEVDDTDKARIKKSYGLKMQFSDSRNPTADSHNPTIWDHNTTTNNRNPTIGDANGDDRSGKETPGKHLQKKTSGKGLDPLPDFCQEKIAQVARDCDGDADQHYQEAERIYQESGKSEDEFYGDLFHAETNIAHNKTMQEFFRQLREIVKR